jgi:hypothetical protein
MRLYFGTSEKVTEVSLRRGLDVWNVQLRRREERRAKREAAYMKDIYQRDAWRARMTKWLEEQEKKEEATSSARKFLEEVKLSPIEAAERGCLDTLKSFHRRGLLKFREPLCGAAAKGGQLEVLKCMRENGCPWDETTCLRTAYGGHFEMLKWVCKNGADVNKGGTNGVTPLLAAVGSGHEAVVRALFEMSADVNKTWVFGATPLYFAIQEGLNAMVWMVLIEAGADVNKSGDEGRAPLHAAAEEGHEGVVTDADQLGRGHQQGEGR